MHVAKHRGIPLFNALRRRRATAVQAGLASAGRRRNVEGAFAVNRGARVTARLAGANILLIDDLPENLLVYQTILEELGQNLKIAKIFLALQFRIAHQRRHDFNLPRTQSRHDSISAVR